jgi:hypothetical protein
MAGSEVPLAVLPLGPGNGQPCRGKLRHPNDLDRALEIALAAGAAASTWARSATGAS